MTIDTLPLSQHALISEEECAEIASRVRDLTDRWTARGTRGFYSLGAASYLDAVDGPTRYLAMAQATNPLLLDRFGGLYDRLTAFFRELLDDEVELDLERAVPGFHIFVLSGEDRSADDPARRAHFDLQWRFAYPGVWPEGALSFTLAVALPSGGGGMALWPLRWSDTDPSFREAWSRTLERPPQVEAYAPGCLVLHDGLILHAIGAARDRAARLRVTLQGHGVRTGGRWRLYW